MSAFPVAAPPEAQKLRGGYYTPPAIAEFLAGWVSEAGERLLEPACGDGALLAPMAASRSRVVGVELESAEAEKARVAASSAEVVVSDFFEWFSEEQHGCWDGVAGNPPFIRFGNWTDPTRGMALEVMKGAGLRPTKLTNAWVPFVVASALALREGGRLGLVVPAELLQVTYAAELRAFLVDEFSELTSLSFKALVFDGILQEVVLLLGVRDRGPARIRVLEIEDAGSLPTAGQLMMLPHAPALIHETEKWTKYFLDPAGIEAVRKVRALGSLTKLGDLAEVDVGVVTGRNQFFVLRPSGTLEHGLQQHVTSLVSKSAHLQGVMFSDEDLARLEEADAPCNLLAVKNPFSLDEDAALRAYVDSGEAEGVHEGYKCSIRKHWWVVPSVWIPDAFLLRQIHDHPRIIANGAGATSTDTIHRMRVLDGIPPLQLAAASINSITFAFSEVLGRSYGGGVLELEPREAEELPFPDPHALTDSDACKVDALLRNGDLPAALDYVDERLLVSQLGLERELVATMRRVWVRLRDRRLARGKTARI